MLSGGVDSTALAWMLRPAIAITVDYGQRAARGEIEAASAVCRALGIEHDVLRARIPEIGMGDMCDDTPRPDAPSAEWWPFRNQLLVTLAAARLIAAGYTDRVQTVVVGSVAPDAGRHVDGSEAFYQRLDKLLKMQEFGLRVSAPALHLDTLALVRESGAPPEVLGWAHSCYRGDVACGQCGGCRKLHAVFHEMRWNEST